MAPLPEGGVENPDSPPPVGGALPMPEGSDPESLPSLVGKAPEASAPPPAHSPYGSNPVGKKSRSLSPLALAAQNLAVEFTVTPVGQAAGCGGAQVMGLNPNGDGFLAVRTGPGTGYRQIDSLFNGQRVGTCARSGNWYGVIYGSPLRKGWVHGNWLGSWAG